MSSWAMAQNCTNAEITSALEGLKALGFNAVTVSPFGVQMNESLATGTRQGRTKNYLPVLRMLDRLAQHGLSMDWIMSEATRLHMTVVFSLFMSWGDTGTALDFGQRRDDECLQFRKSRGNPLCRLSEHCLACDG